MKQSWDRLALKIDNLTLRERLVIFAMAALILVTLVNSLLLDPQFGKQNQLSQKIRQDQSQIAAIRADIQEKAKAQAIDPDAPAKARIVAAREQMQHLQASMRDLQKGLVSPDKMGELLESILKRNRGLRLVSLKNLPVTGLVDASPAGEGKQVQSHADAASNPAAKPPAQPQAGSAVFRHGVEMTVQGTYLDMIDYLAELERLPWQLFWNQVKLDVEAYPQATLTITVFTLSLDKQWLNI